MASVRVTQYASFGGRKIGGVDDIAGTIGQFPGLILSHHTLDAASGATLEIDPEAAFLKFQAVGGEVLFDFNDTGFAALDDNASDYMTPGQVHFQAVVDGRSRDLLYEKFNVKDAP